MGGKWDFMVVLLAAVFSLIGCGGTDDGAPSSAAADLSDDDFHDDADDDADDDTDDDADDDVSPDDDAIDDDEETFPPEEQVPFLEKGFILPPDSLECVPSDTGVPQFNCNHHGSTVAELPDGDMAAVWYHGERESSPDARIVWSRVGLGETEWSWPQVLFDDPDHSEGNPAMWVSPAGELLVFFASIYGAKWDDSKIRLVRSSDGGATWSDPVTLRDRWCWMPRHRPALLDNGDLLLPLYSECLAYPVFMRSSDEFETWTEESHANLGFLLDHLGQIQPALANLGGGRVSAVTRDGFITHRVKRMVSDDNGLTWSTSAGTSLPNSGTSVDQARLLDGRVVVVYNDSPTDRFPLSVALSTDDGESFDVTADIMDECVSPPCSFAYPSIAQNTHDGSIWVTYSFGRQTIGWVHFNEAWIWEQQRGRYAGGTP